MPPVDTSKGQRARQLSKPNGCPCCRGTNVFVFRSSSKSTGWAVYCEDTGCEIRGPIRPTRNEAVKSWNRLRTA